MPAWQTSSQLPQRMHRSSSVLPVAGIALRRRTCASPRCVSICGSRISGLVEDRADAVALAAVHAVERARRGGLRVRAAAAAVARPPARRGAARNAAPIAAGSPRPHAGPGIAASSAAQRARSHASAAMPHTMRSERHAGPERRAAMPRPARRAGRSPSSTPRLTSVRRVERRP